jgi:hypothetical protein
MEQQSISFSKATHHEPCEIVLLISFPAPFLKYLFSWAGFRSAPKLEKKESHSNRLVNKNKNTCRTAADQRLKNLEVDTDSRAITWSIDSRGGCRWKGEVGGGAGPHGGEDLAVAGSSWERTVARGRAVSPSSVQDGGTRRHGVRTSPSRWGEGEQIDVVWRRRWSEGGGRVPAPRRPGSGGGARSPRGCRSTIGATTARAAKEDMVAGRRTAERGGGEEG